MHNHLKHNLIRSGSVNMITGLLAHVPCCGSQLMIGIFGLQTLGAVSTSYLYQYQFYMPLVVTVLLVFAMTIWRRMHHHPVLFCEQVKCGTDHQTNLMRFVITNLAIGYLVVIGLYLVMPPHKHHPLDAHITGWQMPDQRSILVHYHDDQRAWPWSDRVFIAAHQPGATAARELFWFNRKWWFSPITQSIPFHLYARPSLTWTTRNQAAAPLTYFIASEPPKDGQEHVAH